MLLVFLLLFLLLLVLLFVFYFVVCFWGVGFFVWLVLCFGFFNNTLEEVRLISLYRLVVIKLRYLLILNFKKQFWVNV